MDENDAAREFHAIRRRLVAVAYGLLGSVDEAEDAVQESWLRLRRADLDEIEDVTGWLIVTVSRIARDMMRSARRRREEYVGPWLPEPVVTEDDPAERAGLDESLSMALLVVLESLSPAERTVFVLHDVFGVPFAEVAQAVGRTTAACRQLAARARRHVETRAPRFDVSEAERRRVTDAFAAACTRGDIAGLLPLLDPEVVLHSDGGGLVTAARRPVAGAERVARYLTGVARRGPAPLRLEPATVNGEPGLLWMRGDELGGVVALTLAGGRISRVDIVRNPRKLTRVASA